MKSLISVFCFIMLLITQISCAETKSSSHAALVFAHTNRTYPINRVLAEKVNVTDAFWSPRIKVNRTDTVDHILEQFNKTGRLDNFRKAAGQMDGKYVGYHFNDSDVYKGIEALSYMVANAPDEKIESILDELVNVVIAAQEPDGYIHPFITLSNPKSRWRNPQRHELYSLGHFLEAGVAHYQCTGKPQMLNAAKKLADLVCKDFDPVTGTQKRPPEHQVIETGLARLYEVTGNKKYLDMANTFLMMRGKSNGRKLYGEYAQDHKPVLEQEKAVGHAVRAVYMYSSMADIAALTGKDDYHKPLSKIWQNVVSRNMYITGGIGAHGGGESFGDEYYLPNISSYCETCAAIGMVFWNQRMFQYHGDSKYIDVLERTLYNGLISGVSLDGKAFFYPNRLASFGQHKRSPWFGCACCPPNVFRFMPKLGEYIYAQQDENIYVNLFVGSDTMFEIGGNDVTVKQQTNYPWDGNVEIAVSPQKSTRFALHVRIPGWARDECVPSDLYHFTNTSSETPVLKLNGKAISYQLQNGYAVIDRSWQKNDKVTLNMPMPIRQVTAHENVEDDRGKVAIQRGPVVYCAEQIDNPDGNITNCFLPAEASFDAQYQADLLNGVMTITGQISSVKKDAGRNKIATDKCDFTAIPYYAWANRKSDQMTVWFASDIQYAQPIPSQTIAYKSKISASGGKSASAVADQFEPKNSNDHSIPYFHWWPKLGTKEWIQFDFAQPEEISLVKAYWFDDRGSGACRIPESWKVLYKDGEKWKPVKNTTDFGVKRDIYNEVNFEKVKTDAIKVEIQLKKGVSAGVAEIAIK
jgi:DUF1680 family protein